ncbi:nuclear factor of activated T-cells, cytoplasmic 3-like [Seriola lalandi dorsalis]|uniref:nuclear factor of activated T-cells, cytoplasmic 3-like n=1 Tax=Seriola lalandi dorsalis TaxID=1841481 RepID=UPI000C6FA1DA|nr:nuclear factor of activated T-cells, cytoplasmic 3-like [Seriola lalandi dorsalis]
MTMKHKCVCNANVPTSLIYMPLHLVPAGPDLNVRTPPSSTQAVAGQPVGLEPYFSTADGYQHVGCHPQGPPQYGAQRNPRAFDCPSIQITSIAPNSHVEPGAGHEVLVVGGAEGGYPEAAWSRGQLFLPLDPCYRDPALCPSPCSSLSSRSWMSDLSSCESFSNVYDDTEGELSDAARLALGSPIGSPLGSPGCGGGAFGVELWQQKYQHPLPFSPALSPHQSPRQSPRQSPCHSPRTSVTEESWLNRRPTSRPSSRPTSPCGKRRHSSAEPHARSPSPHHSPSPTPSASPRGSVTDDTWVGSPAGVLGTLLMSGYQELDVPSKTRRTSGTQLGGLLSGQGDSGLEPFLDSPVEEGRDQDGLAELFLQVPSHFSWNKPKPGNPPLFRVSSPPPLDWPLPSQYDQCELKLEVQPKSYHRAHYETEGSRGSIKSAAGGHPVVKLNGFSEQPVSLLLFIGTADDRYLRPHSFYQVHRVTGKTVTTTCQEKIMGYSKVLEIPLLPENNMSASIDCAGILKLRNADIELKKGETDIGRKNTRVRVVFRVAVPQPDGRMLWLQTTSAPVECSQRSGQELPHVDSFSPASCSVDGGAELLISGSNISTQSRVVFMEKGPDGRSLWEMDARVLSEKSSGSSIVVEVPPYSKKTSGPVQVQFYVSNGKRKRSLTQSFTFLPGVRRHLPPPPPAAGAQLVKQERWELDHISHNPPGFSPDLSYYDSCDLPVHCGPPSQNTPCFHHPPPSSVPLQTSLMFPHSSSIRRHASSSMSSQISSAPLQTLIPLQTSIMPPQTFTIPPQISSLPPQASSVPLQTFTIPPQTSSLPPQASSVPLQTFTIPPQTSSISPQTSSLPPQTSSVPLQTFTIPPQTSSLPPQAFSVPLQTFTMPPQTSSIPPQSSSLPPQTSPVGPQREQSPSLSSSRNFVTPAGPQKDSLLSSPGEVLSIKQEPEDQPNLGSLGLQEITLDDGFECRTTIGPDWPDPHTKRLCWSVRGSVGNFSQQ